MIGKTILHYLITDKLGAGGMGEVYLAHDERLDRDVALKFLPSNVQNDPKARERFLREAQAASKLTHAHIVGLYYIEHAADQDFIVMEYVRGRSLRDVIAEGDISLEKALGWTRQIAGALSAAHEHGIVHRDIKAENIIITDGGTAKVLDFGLAKVEGATQITDTTSTVGTLAYMSPEQTRGEEVDARADLFSLGVLMYELVAGKQPFRGDHRAAILYAIANESPEPLARYKSGVSDDIQRIVDKALRKDPATRYQSAAGMVADIDALVAPSSSVISAPVTPARSRPAWVRIAGVAVIVLVIAAFAALLGRRTGREPQTAQTPATPPVTTAEDTNQRTMIAVLPFENLGATDDEYFADGITEEITARLARIKELGVIARTSVLRYKGTELPVDQIGSELGVDYILEGTVRWQRAEGVQSRVRVTPQLIKVADATHVWADVFDEPLTAVFEVQSAIAGKVIDEMNLTLVGPATSEVEHPTDNMEAYDAYLRGYNLIYTGSSLDALHTQASADFLRAIELDPEFAEAYAAMSAVYSDIYWFLNKTEENRRKSYEYGIRALDLDPNSATVRHALGMYYYHCELDYDRALEQLEAALKIQPNHAEAIAAIGYVNRRKGNFETAVEYLRKASQLDPRYYHYYFETGETLVDMRRYEEALWYLNRALELQPRDGGAVFWKALLYVLWKGDTATARKVLGELSDSDPDGISYYRSNVLGWLDILDRRYEEAIAGLKDAAFEVSTDHAEVRPRTQMLAQIYWLMGDRDSARIYADSALSIVRAQLTQAPDDSRLLAATAHNYSLMGEKDEALAAARRMVELMPVSKEAKQGAWRVADLILVLIRVGEAEEALDKIEYLLSIHGGLISIPYLRLHPIFDSLRDNPRFKAIVEG